jgi:hypothetical protein
MCAIHTVMGVRTLPCISTLVTALQCLFHLTELIIKVNWVWCHLVLQQFNRYCFPL